jgi:hypothetical protein
MKRLISIAAVALILGSFALYVPAQAATIKVGNDAEQRTSTEFFFDFYNFSVIDTNRPATGNGWLTVFNYYALNQNPFRFLLVDGGGTVRWVSDEITPPARGVNVFTPASGIPVQMGWNLGVYFTSSATITYAITGAPASYTAVNSGLPKAGKTLSYAGATHCTFSFMATGDTQATPPPQALNVTVVKYLDGLQQATATSANNTYFLMTDAWTDPVAGASGAGRFSLGPVGLNTTNPYQAVTATLFGGSAYRLSESTDQYAVGTTCNQGQAFELYGYTVGDTLAQAAAATPSLTKPNLTDMTNNKFIIVWNRSCPQDQTIVAGNDTNGPATRPVVDTFGDFVIVDTNHPVSADGWLTRFDYHAVNAYPLRFVLVDQSNVVQWVSDEITPPGTGVQSFAPAVPVAARKGWNVGLYFASTGKRFNGTVPYEYTGAPAYYRSNLSGSPLPAVGKTLVYEGASNRIYSFAATGIRSIPSPENVTVTVVKYLDGTRADEASANSAEFPMHSNWSVGDMSTGSSGSETFVLGPTGVNTTNSYEYRTPELTGGAFYMVWEDTTRTIVGATCDDGRPYRLVGYTYGDSLAQAATASPTATAPGLNDIASDKFIIVWNTTCGVVDDCEPTDNGHHYGNDKPDNHTKDKKDKCKPGDNGHHYGNDKPDNHEPTKEETNDSKGKK